MQVCFGLGAEGWGLLRDRTRVQVLQPRSGAEKGFYKGPTKNGNNTSAAAVLKCSRQNQAVYMKLNVSLHLLSSGKPKAILLLLALWAKIEQQGREMDYVFWDKLVKMSQGSSVCDAMVNPVGQSL